MHKNKNEALMDAVSNHDLALVKVLLESGVDPDFILPEDDEGPLYQTQPTTPLELVVFRISDQFLEETDLVQYVEITRLLLSYGADPKSAMELAESRHGKYDPEHEKSLFMDVWHLIANAK